jgi:hypothetical protein
MDQDVADAWLPLWLLTGSKDTNRFDTNVGDDDLELLEDVSNQCCLSLVTVLEIPQDEADSDDVLWMKLALL